jgi:hypothetical protein
VNGDYYPYSVPQNQGPYLQQQQQGQATGYFSAGNVDASQQRYGAVAHGQGQGQGQATVPGSGQVGMGMGMGVGQPMSASSSAVSTATRPGLSQSQSHPQRLSSHGATAATSPIHQNTHKRQKPDEAYESDADYDDDDQEGPVVNDASGRVIRA